MSTFLHSATFRLFGLVMGKGAELVSSDRRRELGFDALVEEVLKESFSLAQYSPEGAYPWWQGLSDLFDSFNVRLAGVGAPQLEAPTYERYMELLAKYEASEESSMSEEHRKAISKWARHTGWTPAYAAEVRARAVPVAVAKTMSAALDAAAQLKSASTSETDDRQ